MQQTKERVATETASRPDTYATILTLSGFVLGWLFGVIWNAFASLRATAP